jgi:MFS family permease
MTLNAAEQAPENMQYVPRRWLILATVGLAQLMTVLDLTIVNIALPSAQRSLHFATVDRQWAVTAYALAFGSLFPAPAYSGSSCSPGAALVQQPLVHGYVAGFWWTAAVFAAGAVVCGALLRRGPLHPRRARTAAPEPQAAQPEATVRPAE